jgi:hypothetical protein
MTLKTRYYSANVSKRLILVRTKVAGESPVHRLN